MSMPCRRKSHIHCTFFWLMSSAGVLKFCSRSNQNRKTSLFQPLITMDTKEKAAAKGAMAASSSPTTKRKLLDCKDETRRVRRRITRSETAAAKSAVHVVDFEATKSSIQENVKTIRSSNDKEVVKESLTKLRHFLLGEDRRREKQEVFEQCGGLGFVVSALERYSDCESLQKYGIMVLASATNMNDDIKAKLANLDGMGIILQRVELCPYHCLEAISHLSALAANAESLVQKFGALPLIIKAMAKHRKDAGIVLMGCRVLRNLAQVDALKKRMQGNVVMTLAEAIVYHKKEPNIQKSARGAMKALM